MFCTECGAKNVEGAKFCSQCGKPMSIPESAPIKVESTKIEPIPSKAAEMPAKVERVEAVVAPSSLTVAYGNKRIPVAEFVQKERLGWRKKEDVKASVKSRLGLSEEQASKIVDEAWDATPGGKVAVAGVLNGAGMVVSLALVVGFVIICGAFVLALGHGAVEFLLKDHPGMAICAVLLAIGIARYAYWGMTNK